jgi:hypothetical protein
LVGESFCFHFIQQDASSVEQKRDSDQRGKEVGSVEDNFDIKSYLDSRQIEYKTSGKNVTKGWIEINCILPGCSDPSQHLGINLKTLAFKCWLCGEKGHALKLVQIIEKCSFQKAKKLIKDFPLDIFEEEEKEPGRVIDPSEILPREIQNEWPEIHLDYLKSRGFDPEYLIKTYKIKPVYLIGKYRFRIIIPIFINHRLVSFTAMDILRQDDRPKYMDCPVNESITPVKHCLYNIDSVKDKALIFEGVTGVWRFGSGSVASFTSNLTEQQILLLAKKRIKKVFILFDPDAEDKGLKMAHQLSCIIPSVEQIKFSEGDPKDMAKDIILKLKKEIGL